MINCQSLQFNPELQQERLNRIIPILGEAVIRRLICFALYLLGVKRHMISDVMSVSPGSLRTFIRSIQKRGLPGLEDRRHRSSSFLPVKVQSSPSPAFEINQNNQSVVITDRHIEIKISQGNPLQARTVLLTLLNNRLVANRDVAAALNLSPQHLSNLSRSLQTHDIVALIDKRQGQKHDYRVTPEIKSELIQQFTADVITRGQTSGKAISKELKERCNLSIPERTIRHHVTNMGLSGIKESLPKLVASIKKTSENT